MKPLRLLIVSRRFWPLVGEAESSLAELAATWRARGHHVTVLTAQWEAEWPERIEFRGLEVVRLSRPGRGFWERRWYLQRVRRWLLAHRHAFDVVLVSRLGYEAATVVAAADEAGFPVVLRVEYAGASGDIHWQIDTSPGRKGRRHCFRADAFIAPTHAVERELIAAGYPRDRIQCIPHGVPEVLPRDDRSRHAARIDLVSFHPSLAVPLDSTLLVCMAPLHAYEGLESLIRAFRKVYDRIPSAWLWIIGEGPARDDLMQLVLDERLHGRVAMPGDFDAADQFFLAADLYVAPSADHGASYSMLQAMACGMPVIAADIAPNRDVMTAGIEGLLTPRDDEEALASACLDLLEDRELALVLGAAARHRVVAEHSLSAAADRYLAIFQGLLASTMVSAPSISHPTSQ